MSDTKTPDGKTLSVGGKSTLSLKPRTETGTVRQSFSHGRSKQVVVEVKKRRGGGLLDFDWGRRLRLGVGSGTALLDLDDDLLAAAMAEALAHHAGFAARLERQRLAGHAQLLFARGLGFTHSSLWSS